MTPGPTDPPALPALLAALQAGEEPADAVDGFYRAEHPIVFRLCLGFLADRAEAEDAAQDAMLHLLDRLAGYDPARPYPRWRNTVVLNHCRDRLRRRTTRRAAEQAAPFPAATLPRPDDLASAREVADALQAALSALSPREREAFVLRDLQGCPTDEAAAVLGIAPSSVRSLVTLARRRLRTLLASHLPGPAVPEALR